MAQLDRLFASMVTNLADALVLDTDSPAQLESRGELRPVTRTPLTNAQITALLKEAAPAESHARLDSTTPVTFGRVTNEGAFVIRAMVRDGKWHVEGRIDDKAEFKRMTGQFKALDLPPEEPEPSAAKTAPAVPATPTPAAAAPAVPASAPPVVRSADTRGASALDAIDSFPGSEAARAALDAPSCARWSSRGRRICTCA